MAYSRTENRDYGEARENALKTMEKRRVAREDFAIRKEGSFDDKANLRREIEGTYNQKLTENERDFGRQYSLGEQRETGAMARTKVGEKGAMERALVSEEGALKRTNIGVESSMDLLKTGRGLPQAGYHPSTGPMGEPVTYQLLGASPETTAALTPANAVPTANQLGWVAKLDPKKSEHRKLIAERYAAVPDAEKPAFLQSLSGFHDGAFNLGLQGDSRESRNTPGSPVGTPPQPPTLPVPGSASLAPIKPPQPIVPGGSVMQPEMLSRRPVNPPPSAGTNPDNRPFLSRAIDAFSPREAPVSGRSSQPAYDPGQRNPEVEANSSAITWGEKYDPKRNF